MLSYSTIEPHTLELLKRLSALPVLSGMRLVGGTSLLTTANTLGSQNATRLTDFIWLLLKTSQQ